MYETLLLIAEAVKAGLPLTEAIRLSVGPEPDAAGRKLLALADRLDEGREPLDAVRRSGLPGPVAELFEAALKNGDFADGFLERVRLEVDRVMTRRMMFQTLLYPVFLLLICALILVQLLTYSVPKFEALFRDFDTELPAMTQSLIQLSRLSRDPASLLGLGTFVLVLWLMTRYFFPRFWLVIPVFGAVGRNMHQAALLRQLAYLLHRNVPLPEALERCGETSRNRSDRADCRAAAAAARSGTPLPELVPRFDWLFPAWLAPMLQSDAPLALRRAAETVDRQKDVSLLFLQSMSLPVFLVVMLNLIGFFIVALFMPLIKLMTLLSG